MDADDDQDAADDDADQAADGDEPSDDDDPTSRMILRTRTRSTLRRRLWSVSCAAYRATSKD